MGWFTYIIDTYNLDTLKVWKIIAVNQRLSLLHQTHQQPYASLRQSQANTNLLSVSEHLPRLELTWTNHALSGPSAKSANSCFHLASCFPAPSCCGGTHGGTHRSSPIFLAEEYSVLLYLICTPFTADECLAISMLGVVVSQAAVTLCAQLLVQIFSFLSGTYSGVNR